MSSQKFWSLVFFLLLFASTAQADSITLTVKTWTYTGSAEASVLTIVATDSSGKELALAATFPNTAFVGFPGSAQAASAIGVSPLPALSAIAISPVGVSNSVFSLAASQALPANANAVTNVAIGFTGSLQVYAGAISSPTDPKQPLVTTLSFTLLPGTGVYALGLAGTPALSLTGTGGTLTINQAPTLTPVPEPATLLLLGSGLAALRWRARRRKP